MDRHSLLVLEFNKIISFLKHYVTSPQGGKLCDRLIPLTDAGEIKSLLAEVTEMKDILTVHDAFPIHGIKDIERTVSRTKIEGFYIEPPQLQEIRSTLETGRKLRSFIKGTHKTYHIIETLIGTIFPLQDLEDALRKTIGNTGEIVDTASPELNAIRKKIRQVKLHIKNILETLLHREDLRFIYQEQLITIRNGRFVLPVKIDHKAFLPGVVHDQSQSKATYFIEPLAAVDLNNELQILRKEELREEVQILLALTALVRELREELLFNLSLLEKIDLIYAKARLSQAINACEPSINDDRRIELISCRHPILFARTETIPPPADSAGEGPEPVERLFFDSSRVVPTTIRMSRDCSTLIITGANAGGKTVTLKTLGILALMVQAGMHIPAAEGSSLPVFSSIFADIGDEQNIEESLSTFSAHIRRLNQIIQEAGDQSLVLIDELGAGTDPAEGAALGLALLDHLRTRKTAIAVTTHLTLLKTYAYHHRDAENVSVAFDPLTLKPTYNLVYGIPGVSNAFSIARSMGMSPSLLEKARSYLEDKDNSTLRLLKALEGSQQQVMQRKNALEAIRERAAVHENLAEAILVKLKAKKDQLLRDYESTLKGYLRRAQEQLEKVISEARRKKEPALKEARKSLREVESEWKKYLPATAERKKPIEDLKPGQRIKLSQVNREGVVIRVEPDLKRAEILVGDIKVKAGFDAIEQVADALPSPAGAGSQQQVAAANFHIASVSDDDVSPTINVIGMTVAEALPLVDRAIDHALMKGLETIEIIHGLGTGRLKEAIRAHLKEEGWVKSFAPDDHSRGGAGVTRVAIQHSPKYLSRK
jgi:DNA mismatch repair protein MutS2